MRAGKLRHRITVERPVETQGTSGAMTVSWAPVATVWAEVVPSTTAMRERLAANQLLADVSTVIRMRAAPIIASIGATWRLRLGSTVYNIVGISDVRAAGRELEVTCTSGINDG